ncbi:MAG: type IV pilus modification protein PilV [Burkholderiales bacterium]
MPLTSLKRTQSGVMLLEALIGILIFSIGILAMVGLQAASVKNQADAKYRADASYFANQIIGQMWVDRTNLGTYAHNPTPAVTAAAAPTCNPIFGPSGNANVTAWTTKLANTLPGAAATRQQIIINPGNQVIVAVCWKAPQDINYHKHLAITYIN